MARKINDVALSSPFRFEYSLFIVIYYLTAYCDGQSKRKFAGLPPISAQQPEFTLFSQILIASADAHARSIAAADLAAGKILVLIIAGSCSSHSLVSELRLPICGMATEHEF